jgi:hypothetical protein
VALLLVNWATTKTRTQTSMTLKLISTSLMGFNLPR